MDGWCLFAITIASSFLMIYHLGAKSLWLDEVTSVLFSSQGWGDLFAVLIKQEANQSFYYILLKLWLSIGNNEFIARFPSSVFAVLSIPLLYALGSSLFDRKTGLYSALVLSVNPFFIEYAQEARGYTLVMLLVILSSYYYHQSIVRPSRNHRIGYIVASTLAIYTHFFGMFVVMVQALALLFYEKNRLRWRDFIFPGIAIFALILPLLYFIFFKEGGARLTWIKKPAIGEIYSFFQHITGAGSSRALLSLYAAFCALCASSAFRTYFHAGNRAVPWPHFYIFAWFFLPIGWTYLISVSVLPSFIAKYLIITLPPLALMAGHGVASMKNKHAPYILITLFIALSLRSLFFTYYPAPKEGWREATNFIVSRSQKDDAIFFYTGSAMKPFKYYAKLTDHTDRAPHCTYPYPFDKRVSLVSPYPEIDPERINSYCGDHERLWLVLSHDHFPHIGIDSGPIVASIKKEYRIQLDEQYPGIRVILFNRKPPESG